jgi:hypothetical protein
MVDFSDLPKDIIKKFIVVETPDHTGNRLFIIKKYIPFNERKTYYKKYSTKDIPHKYQQNNTLEEASNSIRNFIIEELKIEPDFKKYQNHYSFVETFWIKLKRFFVGHPL